MSKPFRLSVTLIIAFVALCGVFGCSGRSGNTSSGNDTLRYRPNDTLVVGTLYSPTSYFLYKGDLMGYHYDLIRKFGEDNHLHIEFKVMRNLESLLALLDSAKIDIIAYNIPITAEYKKRVGHCGIEGVSHQVLVQPLNDGRRAIDDVTQLLGKTVVVEKGSKYESRLKNLNDELGGGIKIESMKKDTLVAEDMIEMVADGKIPMTVVDSDIAKLDHTYYDNIDVELEVSFPQKSSWAVKKDNYQLLELVNSWSDNEEVRATAKELFSHYFETSKVRRGGGRSVSLHRGAISEYDDLFKKYAGQIDWDWRLLAAQGYVESKFDTEAVSWAGARGLMQLMPATARHYGQTADKMTDAEASVRASVKYIADLDKSLRRYVKDPTERKRFILAAYNAGVSHIYDAIALAKKYGKNPQVWHGNVSDALLMKSNPEYYNDEVCKFGYFRGRQTVQYVKDVSEAYEKYRRH